MQDRFKFRVWKANEKLMVEGVTYLNPFMLDEKISPDEAKNNILMQCTGLKDKNSKLIYEGDIVKDISLNMIFKVGYKKCAFYLENKEHIGYFHELAIAYSKRLEVIGNIYENPELLED